MKRSHKLFTSIALLVVLIAVPSSALVRAAPQAKARPLAAQKGSLLARVAAVEGVTVAVLKQDLKAGETLLQIAGTRYASADALATALQNAFQDVLTKASGFLSLTNAQVQALQARLHATLVKLVTTPHPQLALLAGSKLGTAVKSLVSSLVATLTATCNSTPANLLAAFKSGGQTPLAICQATNPSITESGLVDALMQALQKAIEPLVQAKKLTAQQELMLLMFARSWVTHFITTPLPTHA